MLLTLWPWPACHPRVLGQAALTSYGKEDAEGRQSWYGVDRDKKQPMHPSEV